MIVHVYKNDDSLTWIVRGVRGQYTDRVLLSADGSKISSTVET